MLISIMCIIQKDYLLWFICFYLFLYVFDEISHILVDLTVISEQEKKIKKYQRNNQLIIEHSYPENLYPPPVKTWHQWQLM